MNVQPGDKLCPLSASVLLDDSDRGLRVVEVVQMNPDRTVKVSSSLIGNDRIPIMAFSLFGICIL